MKVKLTVQQRQSAPPIVACTAPCRVSVARVAPCTLSTQSNCPDPVQSTNRRYSVAAASPLPSVALLQALSNGDRSPLSPGETRATAHREGDSAGECFLWFDRDRLESGFCRRRPESVSDTVLRSAPILFASNWTGRPFACLLTFSTPDESLSVASLCALMSRDQCSETAHGQVRAPNRWFR